MEPTSEPTRMADNRQPQPLFVGNCRRCRRDIRLGTGRCFGPAMDHIAHLLAWAIERGATAANVLDLPFYHPTLEEGLKPALRQICEIVEEPELKRFDDIGPTGA
jgi:hypothetical protein